LERFGRLRFISCAGFSDGKPGGLSQSSDFFDDQFAITASRCRECDGGCLHDRFPLGEDGSYSANDRADLDDAVGG